MMPHRPDENLDIVNLMALETGGRLYANSNDLEGAMRAAVAEASSAYELTFVPDRMDEKPKKHRLKVEVSRPHVRLRYRVAYWSQPTSTESINIAGDVLASPAEATGLSIAAKMDLASQGAAPAVLFLIEPVHTELREQEGRWMGSMEFRVAQFDAQGRMLTVDREQVKLSLEPAMYEQLQREGFAHSVAIKPEKGAVAFRAVVVDHFAGKAGSVTLRSDHGR